MWGLVPRPGIKLRLPASGTQSLSHWTRPAGKSLRTVFFLGILFSVFSHTLVIGVVKSVSSAAFLRRVRGRTDSHRCWARKPAGFRLLLLGMMLHVPVSPSCRLHPAASGSQAFRERSALVSAVFLRVHRRHSRVLSWP